MSNLPPKPWRYGVTTWGVTGYVIVSDDPDLSPDRVRGADIIEDYGGYLVCESVTPQFRELIKAAPEMAWLLREFIKQFGARKPGLFVSAQEDGKWAMRQIDDALLPPIEQPNELITQAMKVLNEANYHIYSQVDDGWCPGCKANLHGIFERKDEQK